MRTTKADVRQGMNHGADDYLTKAFSDEELLAAMDARLARQASMADKVQVRMEEMHNRLVSVLPHELRTPLQGLLAGVELLKDDFRALSPAEMEELIWIIHESSLRMKRLVENNLLYADLELRAADPERPPLASAEDIARVVATTMAVARREAIAASREPDLVLDLPQTAASRAIRMAKNHFSKVVEELVNNAFKYSQPGTEVTVRTRYGQSELYLTV